MQSEPHLAVTKKRVDEPVDYPPGHSCGGRITKIHMLCDASGTPLLFLLPGGQASDISYAQPLLDEVSTPVSQRGRRKIIERMFACL